MISYRSLLLSTIVLNDTVQVENMHKNWSLNSHFLKIFWGGMLSDPLERYALHVTSAVEHLATLAHSIIEAVSWLCVCVLMCACVCVCVVCVCARACVYVCVCVRACIGAYVLYVLMCMYMYVCTYVCVRVRAYVGECTCVCICMPPYLCIIALSLLCFRTIEFGNPDEEEPFQYIYKSAKILHKIYNQSSWLLDIHHSITSHHMGSILLPCY